MITDTKNILSLLLLNLLAILVSGLNFGLVYQDSLAYVELVNWFKGDGLLVPPFCYRPAIPFIASILPFEPIFSISILSLIFLLALTTMIYLICLQVGASWKAAFVATTLATISHSVFSYGAVALIDTSYIFFVALAVFFMLYPRTQNNRFLILATIMIGVFFKESAVIASLAYLFYKRDWRQVPLFTIGPALAYVASRLTVGVLLIENAQDFWIPSIERFIAQVVPGITRFLFLGLASFAWLLLLVPYVKIPAIHRDWFLAVGGAMGLLMLFAMTAASFDSRFIWPLFLGLTPLTALYLSVFKERSEEP